jgi:SPP1 gp7 family putative phage head morphogenesis protein
VPRVPIANEVAFDRGVRHAIRLGRFTTRETNQLLHFLNGQVLPKAERTLRDRLARARALGGDPGEWTTQRIKNIISGVNGVIGGGLRQAGAALREDLAEMAVDEATWQKAVINSSLPKGIAIEVEAELPSVTQLHNIITARPFQGKTLSKWWGKINTANRSAVDQAIKLGIASGETTKQIVRRLAGTEGGKFMDGVFGGLRRNIESTTRTAITHVSTKAREATYKANDDIVKGVEIVATLDSRTTEVCMSEDGKVYPVDSGPRPPFHWNCRTTTVPVLKSFKELGLKDPSKLPAGTRASMTGQVPARQTYQGWLKKQPKRVQEEILGKEKAKLFRSGRVTVKDFVDDKRRTLTLAEIKLREELDDFGVMAAKLSPEETSRLTKSLLGELELAGPAESKKIRAKLRRLGHKGGLKGKVKLPPPGPPAPPPIEPPKPPPPGVTLKDQQKALSQQFNNEVRVSVSDAKTPQDRGFISERLATLDDELRRMRGEFSQFDGWMQSPSKLGNIDVSSKIHILGPRGKKIMGQYNKTFQTLDLGRGRTARAALQLGGDQWGVANSGFDGLARHELGHAFYRGRLSSEQRRAWTALAQPKSKQFWSSNVSRYAGSSTDEAFAEAFSARTHAQYGVKVRLPKDIERFMDDVLGVKVAKPLVPVPPPRVPVPRVPATIKGATPATQGSVDKLGTLFRVPPSRVSMPRGVKTIKRFGEENFGAAVDAITDELARMKAELPWVSRQLEGQRRLIRNISLSPKATLAIGPQDTFIGVWRGAQKKLELVLKGRPLQEARLAVGTGRSWHVYSGKSLRGTFRHELGHALHGRASRTKLGRQWDSIYAKHSKQWWRDKVSTYGATNKGEAFAESFTAYTHPQYGVVHRLPKEVEEFMDKLLRKPGRRRKAAQLAASATRDLGQFDVFAAALSPTERKSLVSDLLVQLRDAGKSQAKSIRAKLRRLGHKGGLGKATRATPIHKNRRRTLSGPEIDLSKPKSYGSDYTKWRTDMSSEGKQELTEWVKGNTVTNFRAFQGEGVIPSYLTPQEIPKWRQRLATFEQTLQRAPRLPGTVYRGVGIHSFDYYESLKNLKNITFKAAASTSRSRQIGNEFMEWAMVGQPGARRNRRGVFFVIKQKSGVDVRPFATNAANRKQQETLLLKNTKFRVINVQERSTLGGKMLEMTLEEV